MHGNISSLLLQFEAEARQVAHALLASHNKEAATAERKVREQYETRLREKQKQLNSVQTRLQVSLSGMSSTSYIHICFTLST